MPYANKYLATLANRAISNNQLDTAAYQQYRQRMVEQATKRSNHLQLVLKHRNLTMNEAGQLYRAGIVNSSFSPSDIGNSTQTKHVKRDSISYYTCYWGECPSCGTLISKHTSTWFIKPYFIAYGFIRVCRSCNARYKASDMCLPVYYAAFWLAHAELGNDIAWSIYRPYLSLGMVYNGSDKDSVIEASEYMRHCISMIK